MKFSVFLSLAIISMMILASCKSPVYIEKDDTANLQNYRTYMWVDTKSSAEDNSNRATAYADISVRNAVRKELSRMGWQEVSSNPDVLMCYDVLVEQTSEQRTDPVYTRPFTRMYYNPYSRRWGTIYYPSYFAGYQYYEVPVKEGTVTITMTDAKTDKTLWQGWTTEQFNNTRITGNEISKSVRNILKKFENQT